jgi:hypothetical protein
MLVFWLQILYEKKYTAIYHRLPIRLAHHVTYNVMRKPLFALHYTLYVMWSALYVI